MKILKESNKTLLTLRDSSGDSNLIGGIEMILDFDSETSELVGLEIVNLRHQLKEPDAVIPHFETTVDGIHWKASYDATVDSFYIRFRVETPSKIVSKSVKGSVIMGHSKAIIGFEIYHE